MADIVRTQGRSTPESMRTRLKDMGDGTHAEVLYLGGGVNLGIDGDYTTSTHTAVTVTTASGAALAANTSRKYALFINDSDTVIYLKLGAAAVANQGIRLNAAGGSYEMTAPMGNLFTGAVNAIHGGTGNKTLLVTEGV